MVHGLFKAMVSAVQVRFRDYDVLGCIGFGLWAQRLSGF